MSAIRLVVGALLFAAPLAQAQRFVVPVEGPRSRSAIAPIAQSPIASALGPAVFAPAFAREAGSVRGGIGDGVAAAPTLTAPMPSLAPSPVAVRLSAVGAAVAQFARVDLGAVSAPEARGAADALMSRVLAEPDSAAPAFAREAGSVRGGIGDGVAAAPAFAREAGSGRVRTTSGGGTSSPYGSVVRGGIGDGVAAAPALTAGAFSAAAIPLSASLAPEPASVTGSRVHLLSRPLHETVELGSVARALHYVIETGFQFGKAALVWQATGSVTAGLAVLAFDLLKTPPMITAQSLADLGVRYWWRKLSTLRRLARTPGVTRIRVLTMGETEFSGILARRRENTGLVFVDTEDSLPETIPGFGAPIPVADLAERRVRLVLTHDGAEDVIVWAPTLAEMLSGRPIPPRVAAAWRARLEADKKGKTRFKRLFDFSKEKELRVEAHLSDGAGSETALGTIAFGRSVKRLVGLGRRDLIGALFGRAPTARAIPISDTRVERGRAWTASDVLRRAWRRLTGRLIAQP